MTIISQEEVIQYGNCFIDTETKISSQYSYNIGLIPDLLTGMSLSEIETELSTNIYVTGSYESGSLKSILAPTYNMYFRPSESTALLNHVYLNTFDTFTITENNSDVRPYLDTPFVLRKYLNRTDRNPTADGVISFTIDWGDGTTNNYTYKLYIGEVFNLEMQHTYTSLGGVSITISGGNLIIPIDIDIEVVDPILYALLDAYDNELIDAYDNILLDSYDS